MSDHTFSQLTADDQSALAEVRSLFKILSLLLDYPSERLIAARQELGRVVDELSHPAARQKCRAFLAHLDATPLIRLQEEYTRLFDLNPSICLNLTFHECGESKARGFALVNLSQLYRNAGYEPATKELPDYLPMVLEFLSVCSREICCNILAHYGSHIFGLSSRLAEQEAAYAGLVEVLSTVVRELAGEGD
jgi:nitrate reductase delta subunit